MAKKQSVVERNAEVLTKFLLYRINSSNYMGKSSNHDMEVVNQLDALLDTITKLNAKIVRLETKLANR